MNGPDRRRPNADAALAARLLLPAIRWDAERGFDGSTDRIEAALRLGVGGFILFGGEAGAVAELCAALRRRSAHPLLIGADLERGAGQQFAGAIALPPAAALGELDDLAVTRRAAELTAREARALGLNWVYAPVADLDAEPENPIVGSRAFGADPAAVSRHVAAWIEGCRSGGALSCAKHFPGHGRTLADSHLKLPVVEADRGAMAADLTPFRAAVEAGVDSIMTAHVAYPAFDPTGSPATLSAPILQDLLRRDFGYRGVVVTDALIMEGVLEGGDETAASVAAVRAGCDALLYPRDAEAVAAGVASAMDRGLDRQRVEAAIERVEAAVARTEAAAGGGADVARVGAGGPGAAAVGEWGRDEDRTWALDIAGRSLRVVRGRPRCPAGPVDLVTVDDDVGGPFPPPPRAAFRRALEREGVEVRDSAQPSADRPTVVALYADIRGWKGRPGVSPAALDDVRRFTAVRPDLTVALFGHPRLADAVPGVNVLAAWAGEPLMQEAAARRLVW